MRIKDVKDSFEASVLSPVSVGGTRRGSWASFEGVAMGGGVVGRASEGGE